MTRVAEAGGGLAPVAAVEIAAATRCARGNGPNDVPALRAKYYSVRGCWMAVQR